MIIPVNTTAQIHIPAESIKNIKENEKILIDNKDIKIIGQEKRRVIVEIGSGEYNFEFLDNENFI